MTHIFMHLICCYVAKYLKTIDNNLKLFNLFHIKSKD